jgi:L-asparagine transporter-like permease
VLIIPSSWGSNWAVIYTPSSNYSGTVAKEKEDFCKGSLSLPICYFVIVLLYFILFASFYQKYKKISSFIVVVFTCLLFSLARMSNLEVEVRTFKQQGGEFERCLVPN